MAGQNGLCVEMNDVFADKSGTAHRSLFPVLIKTGRVTALIAQILKGP